MPTTPFNQVFNALWTLVDQSVPLNQMIKAGNLIKFNQGYNRDPIKQNVQVADLPELVLTGIGAQDANLHESSCGSKIVMLYSFIVSTGDYRITEFLLPVQFGLFCALANYQEVLCALQWEGKSFVTQANWLGLTQGMSNAELNRGIKGWTALWNCLVEMHFQTSDLISYNQG